MTAPARAIAPRRVGGSFLTATLQREKAWAVDVEGVLLEQLQAFDSQGNLPSGPEAQALEREAEALAAEQGGRYLAEEKTYTIAGNGKQVAVLNFQGTIINRAPRWAAPYGYISPQLFAAEIYALADNPNIGGILINMDSGGGTVNGTNEAAEAVAYAARKKPVKVVSADLCCSGAYWIGAQAKELIATPTAIMGSIGVIMTHADFSGWYGQMGVVFTAIRSAAKKALGQPFEPLSEEARAERQALVDAIHGEFVAAIQKGRKISKREAQALASGEVWTTGTLCVSSGIADRAALLSTVLKEMTGELAPPKPAESAAPDPDEGEDGEEGRAAAAPIEGQPEGTKEPHSFNAAPDLHNVEGNVGNSETEVSSMNIKDILAKVAAGEELTAEEKRFLDENTKIKAAAPAADLSGVAPQIVQVVNEANARANAAEARAKAAEDALAQKQEESIAADYEAKAKALGRDPKTFGPVLRAAHEAFAKLPDGQKLIAEYENSVRAAGNIETLTAEIGSTQHAKASTQPGGQNIHAEYESRIAQYIRDNTGASRANAGKAVLAADADFAARYYAQG